MIKPKDEKKCNHESFDSTIEGFLSKSSRPIIILNKNNYITYANNSATHYLKLDINTIQGKNIFKVCPFQFKDKNTLLSVNKISSQEPITTELKHKIILWDIFYLNPQNPSSSYVLLLGTINKKDSNEKTHSTAENELELLESFSQKVMGQHAKKYKTIKQYAENLYEYLDNIIFNLPGSVYWKDLNGVYLGCNAGALDIVNLSDKSELIGKTDYDFAEIQNWQPGVADALKKVDTQVILSRKPLYNIEEGPFKTRYCSELYQLSSKVPLFDKEGDVVGLLGVSIDITDRKLKERKEKELVELRLKNETIEKQVKLYKQLSATVAHELMTPLKGIELCVRAIKVNLPSMLEFYRKYSNQLLADEALSNKTILIMEKSIEQIIKQIASAFLFIEMLLRNMQPEKFIGEPHQTFFVSEAVDEAIENYNFIETQRQKINLDIKNNFIVKGSLNLVIHILFNLFKNALYYIAKSAKGEIYIWTETKQLVNEIHFKDTGAGISAEILPHIFELFFSRTYHGTGVGLSYCKMVMETMGGNISCNSVEGEFTEFILNFPKVQ